MASNTTCSIVKDEDRDRRLSGSTEKHSSQETACTPPKKLTLWSVLCRDCPIVLVKSEEGESKLKELSGGLRKHLFPYDRQEKREGISVEFRKHCGSEVVLSKANQLFGNELRTLISEEESEGTGNFRLTIIIDKKLRLHTASYQCSKEALFNIGSNLIIIGWAVLQHYFTSKSILSLLKVFSSMEVAFTGLTLLKGQHPFGKETKADDSTIKFIFKLLSRHQSDLSIWKSFITFISQIDQTTSSSPLSFFTATVADGSFTAFPLDKNTPRGAKQNCLADIAETSRSSAENQSNLKDTPAKARIKESVIKPVATFNPQAIASCKKDDAEVDNDLELLVECKPRRKACSFYNNTANNFSSHGNFDNIKLASSSPKKKAPNRRTSVVSRDAGFFKGIKNSLAVKTRAELELDEALDECLQMELEEEILEVEADLKEFYSSVLKSIFDDLGSYGPKISHKERSNLEQRIEQGDETLLVKLMGYFFEVEPLRILDNQFYEMTRQASSHPEHKPSTRYIEKSGFAVFKYLSMNSLLSKSDLIQLEAKLKTQKRAIIEVGQLLQEFLEGLTVSEFVSEIQLLAIEQEALN